MKNTTYNLIGAAACAVLAGFSIAPFMHSIGMGIAYLVSVALLILAIHMGKRAIKPTKTYRKGDMVNHDGKAYKCTYEGNEEANV